jgi:hypothetical protein
MKSLFVVTALLRAGIEKQKIFTSCRATLNFIVDAVKALGVLLFELVMERKESVKSSHTP